MGAAHEAPHGAVHVCGLSGSRESEDHWVSVLPRRAARRHVFKISVRWCSLHFQLCVSSSQRNVRFASGRFFTFPMYDVSPDKLTSREPRG